MRSAFKEATKVYDAEKEHEENAQKTYINSLAKLLKNYSYYKRKEAAQYLKLGKHESKIESKLEITIDEDESVAASCIELLTNQFKEKLTPIAANDLAQYFLNKIEEISLKLELKLRAELKLTSQNKSSETPYKIIEENKTILQMGNKACELLEFSFAQNPKLINQSEKENYFNSISLTAAFLNTFFDEGTSIYTAIDSLRPKLSSISRKLNDRNLRILALKNNNDKTSSENNNLASIAMVAINHSLNNQELKLELKLNKKNYSNFSFMINNYIKGMNSKIANKAVINCIRCISDNLIKNNLDKLVETEVSIYPFEKRQAARKDFLYENLLALSAHPCAQTPRAEADFFGAIFYLDLHRKHPNTALTSLTILSYEPPTELLKGKEYTIENFINDKRLIFPLILRDCFDHVFKQDKFFILHKYHLDLSMLYSKFTSLIDKNIETLKTLPVYPQFHELREWTINQLKACKEELDAEYRVEEENVKFKELARASNMPTDVAKIISSYLDDSKEFKVEENYLLANSRLFSSTVGIDQQISIVLKKFNKFIRNIDNFLVNRIKMESKSLDEIGIKQLKDRLNKAHDFCKVAKTSSETLRRLIATSQDGEISIVYHILIKNSSKDTALPSYDEYKNLMSEAAKIKLPPIAPSSRPPSKQIPRK